MRTFDKIKLAKQLLKATPFMNVVRTRLVTDLGCEITHGYITKHNRITLGLAKSHVNDAFVIADGTGQKRSKALQGKQIRQNNRSIQTNRKGFKPSIRSQRYKLQASDLVKFENSLYRVKGVFNYGKMVRFQSLKNGNQKPINKTIRKVEIVKYGKGLNFSYIES